MKEKIEHGYLWVALLVLFSVGSSHFVNMNGLGLSLSVYVMVDTR